jgi:hypothetical protein
MGRGDDRTVEVRRTRTHREHTDAASPPPYPYPHTLPPPPHTHTTHKTKVEAWRTGKKHATGTCLAFNGKELRIKQTNNGASNVGIKVRARRTTHHARPLSLLLTLRTPTTRPPPSTHTHHHQMKDLQVVKALTDHVLFASGSVQLRLPFTPSNRGELAAFAAEVDAARKGGAGARTGASGGFTFVDNMRSPTTQTTAFGARGGGIAGMGGSSRSALHVRRLCCVRLCCVPACVRCARSGLLPLLVFTRSLPSPPLPSPWHYMT